MPWETTTACVRLLVFFRIRRGTFPYGVEDDASTISLTPTTHYTNTCVKLTIVTHLSFSELIAIANLSLSSRRPECCVPTTARLQNSKQVDQRRERTMEVRKGEREGKKEVNKVARVYQVPRRKGIPKIENFPKPPE